ncbi:bifunctional phosphopantothenoylcysteine decarboxylase/phosphopantothenate--cysteine ligase CoaBC [bacterium]|nr:bifunctional phosphopantothenoylcysteine decarboxylase/phosphopantothenate--cysteine ligase CoaBC [bacterium]
MTERSARRVLLGVSGGIAAYKIPELVRLFVKEGCAVKTLLTPNAERFCAKAAIAALSGDSVYSGLFEPVFLEEGHTELAKWADVFVIAPATANTIAKLALGVSDNLLTTTFLASPSRKLIVPSMNTEMYDAAALQANLKKLSETGAEVLPPDVGDLACKTYGAGRMPDPSTIVEAFYRAAGPGTLRGKTVVVSAGASVEALDDVRVITNRSSGKMGTALARAAYRLGADVTLILGRSEVCPLPPVRIVRVDTIDSFAAAYRRFASGADYFLAAAAIGDFIPARPARGKLKRRTAELRVSFRPSPDLISDLAARGVAARPKRVIGFALETDLDERAARAKLSEKNLDAIFLNAASALGSDENRVVALAPKAVRKSFSRMSKLALSLRLFEWLDGLPIR